MLIRTILQHRAAANSHDQFMRTPLLCLTHALLQEINRSTVGAGGTVAITAGQNVAGMLGVESAVKLLVQVR
jgi:hypothetical protein